MSSLSSAVGLVSGLPIQDLVDRMLAPAARPILQLRNRIDQTNAVRTAILDLSARLLALKTSATRLKSTDTFRTATAVSSNADVLTATAAATAAVGDYTFTVRNLASAHQVISGGLASASSTYLSAGTLTIESVLGRIDAPTPLALLNGGSGVRGGRIRITDRAGHSAEVDLTAVRSVSDVLNAINAQTTADVSARVAGDRIVLQDDSGGTGNLVVEDLGGGFAAADLGLRGQSATGTFEGADLVRLSGTTALDRLNDGNGVRTHGVSDDFRVALADGSTIDVNLSSRLANDTPLALLNGGSGVPAGRISITNKAGQTREVDLSTATTVGDVATAIQNANLGLNVTLVGGHFLISDGSTGTGATSVAEVGIGTTAAALGLNVAAAGNTITGRDVFRISALGDVIRTINSDSENGGRLVAEIAPDGDRIRLIDQTTGTDPLTVTALNDSNAALDLGLTASANGSTLTSRRLLAGLNSVLLRSVNGGSGAAGGVISITARSGASAQIDLSQAETLDDVIRGINAAGVGVTARIARSGLGIELSDTTGGTGSLVVDDVLGTLAAKLGIRVNAAVGSVSSGNLQRQYVSETTRLDQFRSSIPFARGKFRVTDSSGQSAVVDLTQGDEVTIGDVIREINSRGIGVTASVNATGDGLLLTDTAGGNGRLTVAEDGGGSTARSLGILGQAAEGATVLNGALETRLAVTAGDTLDSLLARIRASSASVNAAIINDGTGAAPYRLSLTSSLSGAAGQIVIDSGTTGLDFNTLAEGRDATVVYGPPDAASPLVLTSATNSLSNVIPGVTLNLRATSNQPVTISVTRDNQEPVKALKSFIDAYNGIIDRIETLTSFNAETNARGILLGDSSAQRVQSRLTGLVTRPAVGVGGPFTRLSDVGVRFTSGGKLEFDETRYNAAVQRDSAAVERLFTTAENGVGAVLEEQLDQLTDASSGVLTQRGNSLQRSVDEMTRRKTQLEELLEKQRQRLLSRFQATEKALSKLQSQQTALSALGGLSGGGLAGLSSIGR